MTNPLNRTKISSFKMIGFYFIILLSLACSTDNLKVELEDSLLESIPVFDALDQEVTTLPETPAPEISNPEPEEGLPCLPENQLVFEQDGLIVFEFENDSFKEEWMIENSLSNASGEGYALWKGSQYLGNPGSGLVSYNLQINTPGTYQFIWHSAVAMGDSGTDHNDTWLRFPGAKDFYAQKESSKVYPKGSGKSPNPEGAGADGWFKVYRSGNDLGFKWQASTFDNNAHDIFVEFVTPGTYIMEISARSTGHAIDKVLLFKTSISKNEALEKSVNLSVVDCKN